MDLLLLRDDLFLPQFDEVLGDEGQEVLVRGARHMFEGVEASGWIRAGWLALRLVLPVALGWLRAGLLALRLVPLVAPSACAGRTSENRGLLKWETAQGKIERKGCLRVSVRENGPGGEKGVTDFDENFRVYVIWRDKIT